MKKVNWPFVLTTFAICVVWIGVVLIISGCAKPDYSMIQQMHQSTMQSNTAIAAALANGDHKMVSVKFIVEEEMLLPAGTRIEIDTNYDWSRSVQFNDPGHNPAVRVFEAEAARDSAVTQAVVGGLVTGAGIGFGADLLKTAIKRAGSTSLTNAQDGTLTVSGGLGDRQLIGSGGITDSIDASDATHAPTVVQPTVVQQPSPVVVDPVIVQPSPAPVSEPVFGPVVE